MKKKSINEMTRKDFDALPYRKGQGLNEYGPFDSLVILPRRAMHDSGYRCMDFVAVKNRKPVCRLSGCSDVIHIGGISNMRGIPSNYNVDCLPKSGLLHLFTYDMKERKLYCGASLSSFEVYTK